MHSPARPYTLLIREMGKVFVFNGRNHTIEYFPSTVWASTVLIRGRRNILIDPGGSLPSNLPEIHEIWITHAHPDHISMMDRFGKTPVFAHPEALNILRSKNPGGASTKRELDTCLEKLKGASGWRRILLMAIAHVLVRGFGLLFIRGGGGVENVHAFRDGEERYGIKIIFTPGHSPDGVSFIIEDMGIAITGDLITGRRNAPANLFTPSSNPIQALKSIERLIEEKIDIILPGHGRPIYNARERLKTALELTVEEIECIKKSHPWKGYWSGFINIMKCIHGSRKIIARLSALVFYSGKAEDLL